MHHLIASGYVEDRGETNAGGLWGSTANVQPVSTGRIIHDSTSNGDHNGEEELKEVAPYPVDNFLQELKRLTQLVSLPNTVHRFHAAARLLAEQYQSEVVFLLILSQKQEAARETMTILDRMSGCSATRVIGSRLRASCAAALGTAAGAASSHKVMLANRGNYCYVNACVRSLMWRLKRFQDIISVGGTMASLLKMLLKASQDGQSHSSQTSVTYTGSVHKLASF